MDVTEEEAIRLFEEHGVIMRGHFQLTSGRHSPCFLQCSMIMQHPEHLENICRALAARVGQGRVDCVAGPAMGGVILAYEMARALRARAIYAEKSDAGMEFRRGFRLDPGERCLVVEDVITTGGSATRVADLARAAGAEIAGVVALVDRSNGRVDLGVPLIALVRMDIPSYEPTDCPLCRGGIPLEFPKGSRR